VMPSFSNRSSIRNENGVSLVCKLLEINWKSVRHTHLAWEKMAIPGYNSVRGSVQKDPLSSGFFPTYLLIDQALGDSLLTYPHTVKEADVLRTRDSSNRSLLFYTKPR
jgi:hypothetical protein